MRAKRLAVMMVIIALLLPALGAAATPPSAILQGVGIDQKLGVQVPLDLTFHDDDGTVVRLNDLRRGQPVIVALIAYRCPSLCTVVLNDLLSTLNMLPQDVGDQFDVWTFSFDPAEGPDLAAQKKREYLRSYQRAHPSATHAPAGWHFITGDAANIQALTQAVGFHYKWDPASQQFIHPAGLIILTPQGKVARYFFGVDYDPTDLRLSLVEASGGKIGSLTDQVLLFCYHYDPTTGKYGLAIGRALEIGAVLTLLLIAAALTALWRIDRRRTRRGLLVASGAAGKGGP